jgi:cyclic pyranopterin monophosphate synthase
MSLNKVHGMTKKSFTHLTKTGDPTMVDVGAKAETIRTATAQCLIELEEEIIRMLENDEIHTKKGPVFQTAIIAGIMAAKKTSELIPLCHPIALDNCSVHIQLNAQKQVVVSCTAKTSGKTGVEMEALTGATVAALTVYDMCKGFSHNIVIKETRLIEKKGGKSDYTGA